MIHAVIAPPCGKPSRVFLSAANRLPNNDLFMADKLVKSHKWDGTVKSSKCKACES
jgi:hypothetical protein